MKAMLLQFICAAFLCAPLGSFSAEPKVKTEKTIFNADEPNGAQLWSRVGSIAVRVVSQPEAEKDAPAPKGNCVEVAATRRTAIYTRSNVAADWRGVDQITFWIYRSKEEAEKAQRVAAEIHLLEKDGRTGFWRRFDISHTGWKQYTLPLKWLSPLDGRIPQWSRIDRVGFLFLGEATVLLDDVSAQTFDKSEGAYLTTEELLKVAFPLRERNELIVVSRPELFFATDAKHEDAKKIADDLADVQKAVEKDFPFLVAAEAPPTLLVFASQQHYREFALRFGKLFGRVAPVPMSDGYTMFAVATGWWEPKYGAKRPTFIHEFVHSVLERRLLLPNRSEWFQEGIATHYQLKMRPQANLAELVMTGLSEEKHQLPFPRLCDGQLIETKHYWQAVTLLEMMMVNKKYNRKLKELVAAFNRTGSTNLAPHLAPVLGTDWDTLKKDWADYCKETYGKLAPQVKPQP
jgi:hypothetical protein